MDITLTSTWSPINQSPSANLQVAVWVALVIINNYSSYALCNCNSRHPCSCANFIIPVKTFWDFNSGGWEEWRGDPSICFFHLLVLLPLALATVITISLQLAVPTLFRAIVSASWPNPSRTGPDSYSTHSKSYCECCLLSTAIRVPRNDFKGGGT